jgi:uncharacterized protein
VNPVRSTRGGRFVWLLLAFVWTLAGARAAEVIPPAPQNHFNDYAGIVRPATARQLNSELTQFERDASTQLVVAIFPRMQSDSSVEDYTVRVAQKWGVGQKGRNNGAALFVFQQSHDLRIVTGYGLEGALPDALCKRIIEDEIAPRFRAGDFDGGLTAGVHAMMAAVRGEYRGTGRTARESPVISERGIGAFFPFLFFIVIFILLIRSGTRRRTVYSRRGVWTSPWWWGGGGGGWGGGSSGGWSGGGGGTFSGGGGSFGGGGAGGKW